MRLEYTMEFKIGKKKFVNLNDLREFIADPERPNHFWNNIIKYLEKNPRVSESEIVGRWKTPEYSLYQQAVITALNSGNKKALDKLLALTDIRLDVPELGRLYLMELMPRVNNIELAKERIREDKEKNPSVKPRTSIVSTDASEKQQVVQVQGMSHETPKVPPVRKGMEELKADLKKAEIQWEKIKKQIEELEIKEKNETLGDEKGTLDDLRDLSKYLMNNKIPKLKNEIQQIQAKERDSSHISAENQKQNSTSSDFRRVSDFDGTNIEDLRLFIEKHAETLPELEWKKIVHILQRNPKESIDKRKGEYGFSLYQQVVFSALFSQNQYALGWVEKTLGGDNNLRIDVPKEGWDHLKKLINERENQKTIEGTSMREFCLKIKNKAGNSIVGHIDELLKTGNLDKIKKIELDDLTYQNWEVLGDILDFYPDRYPSKIVHRLQEDLGDGFSFIQKLIIKAYENKFKDIIELPFDIATPEKGARKIIETLEIDLKETENKLSSVRKRIRALKAKEEDNTISAPQKAVLKELREERMLLRSTVFRLQKSVQNLDSQVKEIRRSERRGKSVANRKATEPTASQREKPKQKPEPEPDSFDVESSLEPLPSPPLPPSPPKHQAQELKIANQSGSHVKKLKNLFESKISESTNATTPALVKQQQRASNPNKEPSRTGFVASKPSPTVSTEPTPFLPGDPLKPRGGSIKHLLGSYSKPLPDPPLSSDSRKRRGGPNSNQSR